MSDETAAPERDEAVPPQAPLGQEPLTRFPGWRTLLLVAALPVSSVLLYELVEPGHLLGAYMKGHVTGLPHAETVGQFTGLLINLLPILFIFPLLVWIHRRYGKARWDARGLFLTNPVLRQEAFLPWSSVENVQAIEHGVQIEATPEAAPGLWTYHPFSPLIPTEPGQQEAVLEAVSRYAGQVQPGEVFGYTPHAWRSFVLALGVALPAVVAVLFTNMYLVEEAWATRPEYFVLGATLFPLVLGVGGALYVSRDFLARIELRERLLTVASYPISYDDLEVELEGRVACFVSSDERRRGFLRPDEPPRLRAALEAAGITIRDRVAPESRNARVALKVLALIGVGFAVGLVPAGWARLQPADDWTTFNDPYGQQLVIVHERWTGAPRAVALLHADEELALRVRGPYGGERDVVLRNSGAPQLRLDCVAGRWSWATQEGALAWLSSASAAPIGTTLTPLPDRPAARARLRGWIRDYEERRVELRPPSNNHVTRDLARSVPAYLEQLLGVHEGPLGDYVVGRTSRRCYDLSGPREDLVAAVAHGHVLWVVAAPKGVTVEFEGAGMSFSTSYAGSRTQVPPGVSRSSLTGVVSPLSASAPTLEELLQARERLAAGGTVDEVLASWGIREAGSDR